MSLRPSFTNTQPHQLVCICTMYINTPVVYVWVWWVVYRVHVGCMMVWMDFEGILLLSHSLIYLSLGISLSFVTWRRREPFPTFEIAVFHKFAIVCAIV